MRNFMRSIFVFQALAAALAVADVSVVHCEKTGATHTETPYIISWHVERVDRGASFIIRENGTYSQIANKAKFLKLANPETYDSLEVTFSEGCEGIETPSFPLTNFENFLECASVPTSIRFFSSLSNATYALKSDSTGRSVAYMSSSSKGSSDKFYSNGLSVAILLNGVRTSVSILHLFVGQELCEIH